jgi:REP element-mobilizing transposase RayT
MELKKPEHPPRIVDPRSVPFAPVKYRGALPHLFKDGCTYFVTFCLADVTTSRRADRRRNLEAGDAVGVADVIDIPPDEGACILGNPDLAALVERVMLRFQGEHYALSAWCVMPNHVHAVVTPLESHSLSGILQPWKSVSAHRINKALHRKGAVWQRESFDHLVRDEASFERFVTYTETNPVAAGLVGRAEMWAHGSARIRGGGP